MKLKAVVIGLALIFVTGLFIKINFLKIERDSLRLDNERYFNNWNNTIQEAESNKTFYLKEKELSASLKAERDDLAGKLKVKPKQIEKIIHIETLIRDTVIKEIPVKALTDTSWSFTDTINKCSVYSGLVILTDNKPIVKRTGFFDQNSITPVYYWKRPHKFLFIKYGKRKNYVEYSDKCGDPRTEEFNFIK